MIAQLNGAGRRDRIAHQVRQGFWLAGGVSLLLIVLLYNCKWVIDTMHSIDPQLASKALGYLHAIMWGAPGYLFFQVIRNQCEGLSKTKPGMVIGFIGLLINIPINYIFIYGKFGMPQLGGWLRRGHWQRLLAHVPYDTLVRQTSTLAARHQTADKRTP